MGLTYATIEIINAADEYNAAEGGISNEDIRRWNGQCLVDTGALRMAITREMKELLGLKANTLMNVGPADGRVQQMELIGGIKVRFGNRICYTDAFVVENNCEPLLGAIAMEGMDLIVIPGKHQLEYYPGHPETGLYSMK